MKKLIVVLMSLFVLFSFVGLSDTETDVSWGGHDMFVDVDMSNEYSSADLYGSGTMLGGEFHANDGNYERVEVGSASGTFVGGMYSFNAYNDQKGKDTNVGFQMSSNGFGVMSFKTDEWRTGNALKTTGYNNGPLGWSGTDQAILGVIGNYSATLYAGNIATGSNYNIDIIGNGQLGIGTWSAGSTTLLGTGNKVYGNILGKANGSGLFIESMNNVGSMTVEFQF